MICSSGLLDLYSQKSLLTQKDWAANGGKSEQEMWLFFALSLFPVPPPHLLIHPTDPAGE